MPSAHITPDCNPLGLSSPAKTNTPHRRHHSLPTIATSDAISTEGSPLLCIVQAKVVSRTRYGNFCQEGCLCTKSPYLSYTDQSTIAICVLRVTSLLLLSMSPVLVLARQVHIRSPSSTMYHLNTSPISFTSYHLCLLIYCLSSCSRKVYYQTPKDRVRI